MESEEKVHLSLKTFENVGNNAKNNHFQNISGLFPYLSWQIRLELSVTLCQLAKHNYTLTEIPTMKLGYIFLSW